MKNAKPPQALDTLFSKLAREAFESEWWPVEAAIAWVATGHQGHTGSVALGASEKYRRKAAQLLDPDNKRKRPPANNALMALAAKDALASGSEGGLFREGIGSLQDACAEVCHIMAASRYRARGILGGTQATVPMPAGNWREGDLSPVTGELTTRDRTARHKTWSAINLPRGAVLRAIPGQRGRKARQTVQSVLAEDFCWHLRAALQNKSAKPHVEPEKGELLDQVSKYARKLKRAKSEFPDAGEIARILRNFEPAITVAQCRAAIVKIIGKKPTVFAV